MKKAKVIITGIVIAATFIGGVWIGSRAQMALDSNHYLPPEGYAAKTIHEDDKDYVMWNLEDFDDLYGELNGWDLQQIQNMKSY